VSDQPIENAGALRWAAATVGPLTMTTNQASAVARGVFGAQPVVAAFAGVEGEGCPLSAAELLILRRELALSGGVL
jgi:hypothetical protein